MPTFEIIEGKRHHCGEMSRRLRAEQTDAAVCIGANVHRRLVEVFEQSSFCRAWLVDGRLCGLGGVQGPMASATGEIWLALTNEACRHPVATFKQARRTIQEIMQMKRQIVTVLFESDFVSIRFALSLGFKKCGDAFVQNGQKLIPVSIGADTSWLSQPHL